MGQKISKKKLITKSETVEKRMVYSDPVLGDRARNEPVFFGSLPSSLSHLDNEEEEAVQENPASFPPETTIFNKMNAKGRRVKTPTVLFYYDHKSKLLWVLDEQLKKWRFNDLLYARFESDKVDFSRFEEAIFRAELPEVVRLSTLVFTDNKTIHIIGRYHLEYKVWSNSFKLKDDRVHNVNFPTVCYGANNIFCVSGEEKGEYTNKCQRYIVDKGVWVPFKDIPEPHTFGSATCYTSGDDAESMKLVVIGGYSSAKPKMFNQNISIYDFKGDMWTKLTLNIFTRTVPKFIRAPLVQSEDGRLFVFGSTEGPWECYEIDLQNEKLKSFGEVPNKTQENQTNLKDPSPFYVNDKEEVVLLLDEMVRNNDARQQKTEDPIIKSIKDLSIWKFNMLEDAKEEDDATYYPQ